MTSALHGHSGGSADCGCTEACKQASSWGQNLPPTPGQSKQRRESISVIRIDSPDRADQVEGISRQADGDASSFPNGPSW